VTEATHVAREAHVNELADELDVLIMWTKARRINGQAVVGGDEANSWGAYVNLPRIEHGFDAYLVAMHEFGHIALRHQRTRREFNEPRGRRKIWWQEVEAWVWGMSRAIHLADGETTRGQVRARVHQSMSSYARRLHIADAELHEAVRQIMEVNPCV